MKRLVQTLERERSIQRQALCQAMFLFQNAMQRPGQHSARTLSFLELDEGPVMPDLALTALAIILVLRERPQGKGSLGHVCIKLPCSKLPLSIDCWQIFRLFWNAALYNRSNPSLPYVSRGVRET